MRLSRNSYNTTIHAQRTNLRSGSLHPNKLRIRLYKNTLVHITGVALYPQKDRDEDPHAFVRVVAYEFNPLSAN